MKIIILLENLFKLGSCDVKVIYYDEIVNNFNFLTLTSNDPNINPDNIKLSIISKYIALKDYNMKIMKIPHVI